VIGKLRLVKPRKIKAIIRERYATERFKEEGIAEAYKEKINSMRMEEEAVFGGVEEEWTSFKNAVKRSASEILGTKRMSVKKRTTVWWTE